MSLSVFDFPNVASVHCTIQTVKGNKKLFRTHFSTNSLFSANENQYFHETKKFNIWLSAPEREGAPLSISLSI